MTDGCFLNNMFSKLHTISAVKHTLILVSCSFKLNQQSVKSFYHSVIYSMTAVFLTLPSVIGSVDKDFVGFICNNINYYYVTSGQSV